MPTNIYTIYKHTSPAGKSYIGVTKNGTAKRFHGHFTAAKRTPKGNRTYFQRALIKYGSDGFISEELFYTNDKDTSFEMEVYFIDLYDTHNSGYNSTPGGEDPPTFYGEDHPNYGKSLPHTEETKKKMSESRKGDKHWNYGNTGEGTPMYGKTHSEETKKKMSKGMTGIKKKRITCPHCNLTAGANMIKRYHLDKCKSKI